VSASRTRQQPPSSLDTRTDWCRGYVNDHRHVEDLAGKHACLRERVAHDDAGLVVLGAGAVSLQQQVHELDGDRHKELDAVRHCQSRGASLRSLWSSRASMVRELEPASERASERAGAEYLASLLERHVERVAVRERDRMELGALEPHEP